MAKFVPNRFGILKKKKGAVKSAAQAEYDASAGNYSAQVAAMKKAAWKDLGKRSLLTNR